MTHFRANYIGRQSWPKQLSLKNLLVQLAICLMVVSGYADEKVLLLDNFELAKLSQHWTAIGKIGVQRIAAPEDSVVAGVAGIMAKKR